MDEFGYWFTSELQNALLLFTYHIKYSQYSQVKHYFSRNRGLQPTDLLPFGAVLISIAASYYDSGPGSLLYPIALICAIRYKPIVVALISFTSAYIIYHVLDITFCSIQTNISVIRSQSELLIMMTIAPLTVSSISVLHSEFKNFNTPLHMMN